MNKKSQYNIGLLVIGTNKYSSLLPDLIISARDYFLKNHKVTIYVFTNHFSSSDFKVADLVIQRIEHEKFPLITLRRYNIFLQHRNLFENEDYVFYIDADMRFVDKVDDEILGDLVAVQHPGYIGNRGTPENNSKSTAYISDEEDLMYFTGAFNGGKTSEYLKMAKVISENVNTDLCNGIIAKWWDESHLNRYLLYDKKPTLILNPSYCYPDGGNYNLQYKPKILAISKDHKTFQI